MIDKLKSIAPQPPALILAYGFLFGVNILFHIAPVGAMICLSIAHFILLQEVAKNHKWRIECIKYIKKCKANFKSTLTALDADDQRIGYLVKKLDIHNTFNENEGGGVYTKFFEANGKKYQVQIARLIDDQ